MKVNISPFLIVYSDGLLVFYRQDIPVMKVSLPVDQEILDAYSCSSVREYYSLIISPMLQEELEFDSSEMYALSEFLEKNNYFETPVH